MKLDGRCRGSAVSLSCCEVALPPSPPDFLSFSLQRRRRVGMKGYSKELFRREKVERREVELEAQVDTMVGILLVFCRRSCITCSFPEASPEPINLQRQQGLLLLVEVEVERREGEL